MKFIILAFATIFFVSCSHTTNTNADRGLASSDYQPDEIDIGVAAQIGAETARLERSFMQAFDQGVSCDRSSVDPAECLQAMRGVLLYMSYDNGLRADTSHFHRDSPNGGLYISNSNACGVGIAKGDCSTGHVSISFNPNSPTAHISFLREKGILKNK